MSLKTDGKAPGPVRFYLLCDRLGCEARAVFELVIAQPPPDREEDIFGHLLHEAEHAHGHIAALGWTFIMGGEGYWCPRCSGHRSGPAPVTVVRESRPRVQRSRRRRPR